MSALSFSMAADTPDEFARTIERARRGDLDAFESLIRQYERLVLATALRLTGNLHDAQDASQDVFLKLYRNLPKVEASENLSAWLYRVTVNVCHDLRRKRPARSPLDDAAEIASLAPDPHRLTADAERRHAIALSLRLLSEKERAALVLRDLEGLPTAEVARILGSTDATVRSQIAKGRIKMKEFMERYFRRRS
jgi:RNA polymerase sigma-70 factor, ECF subfamily